MKGRKVTGSSRGEKKKIRRLRNSQNVFVSDSACLDLICQIKILAVKLLFSVVAVRRKEDPGLIYLKTQI